MVRKAGLRSCAVRSLLGVAVLAVIGLLALSGSDVSAQQVGGRVSGFVGAGPDPYSSTGAAGGAGEVIAGVTLGIAPFEKQEFELSFQYRGYDRGYVVVEGTTTAASEQVLREALFNVTLMADIWRWRIGRFALRPDLGFALYLFENEKVPSAAAGPAAGLRLSLELPFELGLELRSFIVINVIQKDQDELISSSSTTRRSSKDGEVSWGVVTVQPALWWRPANSNLGVGVSYGLQVFGMPGGEVRLNHGATALLEFRFGQSTAAEPAPSSSKSAAATINQAPIPLSAGSRCAEDLAAAKAGLASLERKDQKATEVMKRLAREGNCSLRGSDVVCKPCPVCSPTPGPKGTACAPPRKCKACPKCRICQGIPRTRMTGIIKQIRQEIMRLGPENIEKVRRSVEGILKKASR